MPTVGELIKGLCPKQCEPAACEQTSASASPPNCVDSRSSASLQKLLTLIQDDDDAENELRRMGLSALLTNPSCAAVSDHCNSSTPLFTMGEGDGQGSQGVGHGQGHGGVFSYSYSYSGRRVLHESSSYSYSGSSPGQGQGQGQFTMTLGMLISSTCIESCSGLGTSRYSMMGFPDPCADGDAHVFSYGYYSSDWRQDACMDQPWENGTSVIMSALFPSAAANASIDSCGDFARRGMCESVKVPTVGEIVRFACPEQCNPASAGGGSASDNNNNDDAAIRGIASFGNDTLRSWGLGALVSNPTCEAVVNECQSEAALLPPVDGMTLNLGQMVSLSLCAKSCFEVGAAIDLPASVPHHPCAVPLSSFSMSYGDVGREDLYSMSYGEAGQDSHDYSYDIYSLSYSHGAPAGCIDADFSLCAARVRVMSFAETKHRKSFE